MPLFTFCIGSKLCFKKLLIKNKEKKDWIERIIKVDMDGFSSGDYIWLEKPDLRILIHELTHHAFTVFEHKRIPLTRDTKEPHAYYMEFLFKECKKLIDQVTIK